MEERTPIAIIHAKRPFKEVPDEKLATIYLAVVAMQARAFKLGREALIEDIEDECAHRGLDYTFWEN